MTHTPLSKLLLQLLETVKEHTFAAVSWSLAHIHCVRMSIQFAAHARLPFLSPPSWFHSFFNVSRSLLDRSSTGHVHIQVLLTCTTAFILFKPWRLRAKLKFNSISWTGWIEKSRKLSKSNKASFPIHYEKKVILICYRIILLNCRKLASRRFKVGRINEPRESLTPEQEELPSLPIKKIKEWRGIKKQRTAEMDTCATPAFVLFRA